MTTLLCDTLPYHPDSLSLMALFIDLPWPIFLDSGHSKSNNYPDHHIDIIAANPSKHLISRNNKTYTKELNNKYNKISGTFFSALRSHLPSTSHHPNASLHSAAPGWMGCLSYDLSKQLEHLPTTTIDDTQLPDAAFGFYEWVIATNHKTKTTCVIYIENTNISDVHKRLSSMGTTPENFQLTSNFKSDQSKISYQEKFRKIKISIKFKTWLFNPRWISICTRKIKIEIKYCKY